MVELTQKIAEVVMTGSKTVVTRFPPSPTGFLHIGNLRTALYNFLFAKQNHGKFIFRLEDTDRARYLPEAEKNIFDTLKVFGLNWDEGPFRQSERLAVYKKYAEILSAKGLVYEDAGALRFKMAKEGSSKFTDIIRGEIEIENKDQEDFVILKSDGYPTYNFAHLIDDHDMGVNYVIRGEEFIPSMPKYLALHKALNFALPQYAHLPLLLNKNRAKLSKREGDVAVLDFLNKGYLVEALTNFVALLGWHPSKSEKEIYSLAELVEEFKLEEVQKGGAIFDLDKLDWFQHVWAVRLYEENKGKPESHPLYPRLKNSFEILSTFSIDKFELIFPHIIERLGPPADMNKLVEEFDFFFTEPHYSAQALVWKKSDAKTTKAALAALKIFLANLPDENWSGELVEKSIKEFIKESGYDAGTVLWPLRVALTGKEKSMGPFEIMDILNRNGNRELIFNRIEKAINLL